MTTRILPEAEWARLKVTGCGLVPAKSAAIGGHVLVVEDDGEIVGCCLVFACAHVDGAWIHPAYRTQVAVGRRLLMAIRDAVHSLGVTSAWVSAVNDRVSGWMLDRFHGQRVPGEQFIMSVEK